MDTWKWVQGLAGTWIPQWTFPTANARKEVKIARKSCWLGLIPWLLSLDRKLIYYSGGDENMALISLKWLCTCWICYQIQEDAKKDFENELERGVFSLSTDGKGCLAQTICKHWSFAHKVHLIPVLVFNSTCTVKLFTSGPASGLLQAGFTLNDAEGFVCVWRGEVVFWGCSTLMGGGSSVSMLF